MVARTVDQASRVMQHEQNDVIYREKSKKSDPPADESNAKGNWKSRKQLHLIRKIFHALAGVAMAGVYQSILTREQTLWIFGTMFTLLGLGEYIRLKFPNHILSRIAMWIMQALARTYEMKHATGMIYFVTGVLICVGFFPKKVAVLSILFLAIGDPCASTCGITWGYLGPKFSNGKSLVGFLGGVLSCAITTFLFYYGETGLSPSLFLVSLLGGFSGGITELLCGRVVEGSGGPIDIDDNLAVPVGSGFLFYLGLQFFPSFL
mmetsp:Transcript_24492/g.49756  ORF Transcript_24492/g.49756 Transcript_24492/m.49756 type:complete len:263 (-) Transcript_24492:35-823(-)